MHGGRLRDAFARRNSKGRRKRGLAHFRFEFVLIEHFYIGFIVDQRSVLDQAGTDIRRLYS